MKYYIQELENQQSYRESSIAIEARSLSQAKAAASRQQLFQGTVLTIRAPNGALLSLKTAGRWQDGQ